MTQGSSEPDVTIHALADLLAWYQAAGVDCAVGDDPVAWLGEPGRIPGSDFAWPGRTADTPLRSRAATVQDTRRVRMRLSHLVQRDHRDRLQTTGHHLISRPAPWPRHRAAPVRRQAAPKRPFAHHLRSSRLVHLKLPRRPRAHLPHAPRTWEHSKQPSNPSMAARSKRLQNQPACIAAPPKRP